MQKRVRLDHFTHHPFPLNKTATPPNDLPLIHSTPTFRHATLAPAIQRAPSVTPMNPDENVAKHVKRNRLSRPYDESLSTVETLQTMREIERGTQKLKNIIAQEGISKTKKPPVKR